MTRYFKIGYKIFKYKKKKSLKSIDNYIHFNHDFCTSAIR